MWQLIKALRERGLQDRISHADNGINQCQNSNSELPNSEHEELFYIEA